MSGAMAVDDMQQVGSWGCIVKMVLRRLRVWHHASDRWLPPGPAASLSVCVVMWVGRTCLPSRASPAW